MLDTHGQWQSCNAVLDTGNHGPTLIRRAVCERLGLAAPQATAPSHFQRAIGSAEITGVVPGAHCTVPLITASYRVGDTVLRDVTVGMSESEGNWDVLVSSDHLKDIQAQGYTLRV